MNLNKTGDIRCVLVESGSGAGLAVREAEGICLQDETVSKLCICRIEGREAETVLKGERFLLERGDILFSDNRELLCRKNIRDFSAEILCLDARIFSACSSGLLGERVFSFFHFLADTHYCHKQGMMGYETLNAALQSVWDELDAAGRVITETVVSALWGIAALLKKQMGDGLPDQSQMLLRNQTRLMPVIRYLQENYDAKITLPELAAMVNMSVPNFSAVFRKTMGMPPVDFLIRLRIQNASYQLKNTDKKIIDIAEDCGFTSISNFIKAFHRHYGISPLQYRTNGGPGG